MLNVAAIVPRHVIKWFKNWCTDVLTESVKSLKDWEFITIWLYNDPHTSALILGSNLLGDFISNEMEGISNSQKSSCFLQIAYTLKFVNLKIMKQYSFDLYLKAC